MCAPKFLASCRFFAAGKGDDLFGAEASSDLHHQGADTVRGALDEDRLAFSLHDICQHQVGGKALSQQRRACGEAHGVWQRRKGRLAFCDVLRKTTDAYSTEYPVAPSKLFEAAAQALALAVTSGLHYGGVATRAAMPDEATVHVVVDTRDLGWRPTETGGMEIATVSVVVADIGKDGKAQDYKVETMHARASSTAAAAQNGKAEFVVPCKPNEKAALLRIVVRDQDTGRIGSFDLPLPAGR